MVVAQLLLSFYLELHVQEFLLALVAQLYLLLLLLQLLLLYLLDLEFAHVVRGELLLHEGVHELLILQLGPFFLFLQRLLASFGV